MKVVICPDAYKGGPTAAEVAAAIATGWRSRRAGDHIVLAPLADGGEGTLDAMETAVTGAARRTAAGVVGPDGRPVDADYLLLPDGTAVVELAASSGLPLLKRLDPCGSTTRGLGQVIAAALDSGARRLLVGLGGSASTDGGVGMLAALGADPSDADGRELSDGGGALVDLDRINLGGLRPPPPDGVEVMSDVDNPLLGPSGAAAVFGPQKGADSGDIERLEAGLSRLAERLGGNPGECGAGAAGGTAYSLAAVWGARLRSGSRAIAEEVGIPAELEGADLVVTGEGRLDCTSLAGKVVSAVLALASPAGVPVAIVAGAVDNRVRSLLEDNVRVVSTTDLAGSADASIADPKCYLAEAGRRLADGATSY